MSSYLSFKNITDVLNYIADHAIEYVTFNFTDTKGKLQHTQYHFTKVDKDLLNDGFYFDGSSIAGWRPINKSDMCLRPDITRAYIDPYAAQPTLGIFCDVVTPEGDPYEKDPRSIAKKAEKYMKSTGIADSALFGPEPEFFVFNDVRYKTGSHGSSYIVDGDESPVNSDKEYTHGNTGHRPGVKGGYFPVPPVDSLNDLRAQIMSDMKSLGVEVEKHHHEVAPSQCELGITADSILPCADNVQLYKYAVLQTCNGFGYTATFMPKPIFGDNGSGMHIHQSLRKGSKAIFAGKEYAGLSETALFYIGGVIKHARALNAFTNPTTNSYKRLVPGYEAPTLLAYSEYNRSAACRIPLSKGANAKRAEFRFPDPLANPYLAFSAMLMAGLDGIENKIHPGDAAEEDLYALTADQQAEIPTVCGSLREALDSLRKDHDFLMKGDVFTKKMIDAYIELKMEEVIQYELRPHPVEFEMYYSS